MYMSTPYCNSVTLDQLKLGFAHGEAFLDLLFSFSARFSAFELTQAEISIFSALMLINTGEFIYLIPLSMM